MTTLIIIIFVLQDNSQSSLGTFPGGLNLTLIVNSSAENITGLVFQCPVSSGECGALGRGGDSLDAASGVRLFDDQRKFIKSVSYRLSI